MDLAAGARRHPVLVVASVALVALLVAEGVARALAPALPAPSRWGDATQAAKVDQMEDRSAAACVDVVVAGDSMARDDLVPSVLAANDPVGRRFYNAALDAAGPDLLAPWLRDQVVPRLDPATVVVALSSIDLNVASPGVSAATDAYTGSVGGRQDLLGRVERWAADRSALVEHRRALRDPDAVATAVGDRLGGEEATDPAQEVGVATIDADGAGTSRRDLTYAGPSPATAFARDQLLAGFDLGPDPAGRVADLVEDVASTGTDVVVLLLPVTDDFAELHPGGADDLAAARAAVVEGAGRAGVPVVDLLDDEVPGDGFADTHHLNGVGADALSARLPDLLAEAGVAASRCSA